jgi:hypothetical protein
LFQQVTALAGKIVVAVACGDGHTVAVFGSPSFLFTILSISHSHKLSIVTNRLWRSACMWVQQRRSTGTRRRAGSRHTTASYRSRWKACSGCCVWQ